MNEASQIIDALGGTAATARLCEVQPAAVSQWREGGIPKARLQFLKLARPELFSDVDQAQIRPDRRTGSDRRKKEAA